MSNRALLMLSSFIEANGLGRPDLWGKAILSLQVIQQLNYLFGFGWYLSACITFTLYQAMLFSTTRSPKLSDSIAPAPNRARIIWIQQTNINIPLQQNQRLLTLERRPSSSNLQLENLININEINN
ncbi:unnamed protein product [Meloidogyne enterolobii]|uniref:Uncharacterized protein n=1 Tax=Meloidogyne enterolobii TaxID=390850 RepID=A0ACB1B111_MELEN